MNSQLMEASRQLGLALTRRRWHVATAESCTGGGVAAAITAVPNSSTWFEYGIVSYANSAKRKLLHVNESTLAHHGAVSEAVVREMVDGALALSGANLAVAVSGVAGPGGGTPEKPVGTVWFCWGTDDGARVSVCRKFEGDRLAIQEAATLEALSGLIRRASEENTV